LVWLDYDRALDDEMLRDIDGCVSRLAPGSIFIVTVDARPRIAGSEYELSEMSAKDREKYLIGRYREWFGQFAKDPINANSLTANGVTDLFQEVVTAQIARTLAAREGLQYVQLFNYLYRDGAPMLTVGGVVADAECTANIETCGILDHRFVERGPAPMRISVPPLTFREKQWLDKRIGPDLRDDNLAFELEDGFLDAYQRYYKEYPTFTEALL
ncbi:MAG TPA: O-methyltransferase, partial [Gemmataceae bacterium]